MACAGLLASGCALFGGGGDEEDMSGSSSGGGSEFGSEGGLGGSGGMEGGDGGLGIRVAELESVYFDYDRASIRNDQKPVLRSDATAIEQNGSWRTVVVEGHCDERGSEEYNLALGERRANAVKQYLVDSGVSAGRIDTVSFGEAKPAVQGHDESAWKYNRRADFRVIMN